MTEPIRVLIADDEDLVRSGLSLMLGSQPGIAVVGDAADGAQAVAQAQHLRPDIVLMDIRMPGMDGLQATARITAAADDTGAGHQVRVIILTTFEQDEYVYEALRAGASGFLLKRTRPEDLIEAIRVVANGDALLAPSVTRRLIAHFAHRPTTATATAAQLSLLTERERDVLIEIAGGLSNTEIARRLFVGEQTVKTHIKHIFTKLDLRDRAQAVVFAYETGLVRAGDTGDHGPDAECRSSGSSGLITSSQHLPPGGTAVIMIVVQVLHLQDALRRRLPCRDALQKAENTRIAQRRGDDDQQIRIGSRDGEGVYPVGGTTIRSPSRGRDPLSGVIRWQLSAPPVTLLSA